MLAPKNIGQQRLWQNRCWGSVCSEKLENVWKN